MTRIGGFGRNQFAYQKEKGARDALAYIVLTWIVALNSRCKIGVYCSDVSGAFDRVSTETLLNKLEAKGVHPFLLKLAASWLQSRKASVLVGGACSETFDLCNMVCKRDCPSGRYFGTYSAMVQTSRSARLDSRRLFCW
jgi:hypothetical protein